MAGWILAPIAAFWGQPLVLPLMQKFISRQLPAQIAGGALIFILVLIIASIITNAISKAVGKSVVSGVDRSLGFVFGLARGLVAWQSGLSRRDLADAAWTSSPRCPDRRARARFWFGVPTPSRR